MKMGMHSPSLTIITNDTTFRGHMQPDNAAESDLDEEHEFEDDESMTRLIHDCANVWGTEDLESHRPPRGRGSGYM